jgi:hypothetical protein
MKPLPVQGTTGKQASGEAIPSLPPALPTQSGPYSNANRRASACPINRAYPWLLAGSTAIAAIFCLMYITKPVVISTPEPGAEDSGKTMLTNAKPSASKAKLMPNANRLPGETSGAASNSTGNHSPSQRTLPAPPSSSVFEETNIRVQHVLTAEAPGGHKARIDIDVPALYQSRSLRWSPDNVASARKLLIRLMDYQDKSRKLRAEGVELLDSWNQLIGDSIPAPDLRADSPSLPANQEDASDAPRPSGLITTESIQLQPAGK